VVHGVRHGGGRARDPDLADAPAAERVDGGIRLADEVDLDRPDVGVDRARLALTGRPVRGS